MMETPPTHRRYRRRGRTDCGGGTITTCSERWELKLNSHTPPPRVEAQRWGPPPFSCLKKELRLQKRRQRVKLRQFKEARRIGIGMTLLLIMRIFGIF
ncbi:hypothetical protein U1Q18_038627 [Sarracenia purpurea var. burkii]